MIRVQNINSAFKFCEILGKKGVTILHPQRDRKMAFIRSPDQISIEFLPIPEPLAFREN